MAERFARLYGPGVLSAASSSPTTLFTVPTSKLYIVRGISAVSAPISGAAVTKTIAIGKTSAAPANLITGVTFTTSTSGYTAESQAVAIPFTEGEVVVGFDTLGSIATSGTAQQYTNGTSATNFGSTGAISSTTDATSYATIAFTPQAQTGPHNIYFCAINTKATTPDAISSITDAHATPAVSNIGSIVTAATAATSGVRASIWGGYASTVPTDSAATTIAFGGTQTGLQYKGITVKSAGMVIGGTPSTSNILLQTATATGTTETVQGVTMTPTTSGATWQILVVGCTGVASSYTGPTAADGGTVTEQADGTLATPNVTAAIYFIYPAVTNPAATIASAGTDWAAVCIEGSGGGYGAATLAGIIVES